MRVAILARDFPPARGGLSTYAFGLVQQLRAQGTQVDVLVGRSDLRTLMLPLSVDLSPYDVVHVMSPPYAFFVRHPHVVITVAEPAATEWPYYNMASKLRAGPAYVIERLVFRRENCIVGLSEASREKLKASFGVDPASVRVIPGGVELSEFSPAAKAVDPPRILLVSRLDRRKNIPEALRGLSMLRGERFECVAVGGGPERRSLEGLAKSLQVPIRFAGRVSDEDLQKYYSTSPIFVTSSFSEGFGLSLLQAMSAGCAVVASDIGAHRELVRDGEDGLLYHGADDLAAKLTGLLRDSSRTAELGARAREATAAYSWSKIAETIRGLYEELCRA